MKDFDKERKQRIAADRSFTVGGVLLHRKASVRPEVLAEWDELTKDGLSGFAALAKFDEMICEMVEEPHLWRELREADLDGHPLGVNDVLSIMRWLVEEAADRPTELSSPSTPGQSAPDGTASTAPTRSLGAVR